MEYLLLAVGIIAGITALVLLFFLAKLLWRFGKYLKVRLPALWYIYSGFWLLLLLIILLAIFVSAVNFYTDKKELKAKESFLESNSHLIDRASTDFMELKYLSDSTFYVSSDVEELASCIPSFIELKKNYDDHGSDYFDLSYAIIDRAEEMGSKLKPWNNLSQKERDRISLKIIDCDKTLGLLTDDEYERQKRLVLVKIKPIPVDEIKKEIESLREAGMSDAKIMDALLTHKDFGANLKLLAKRLEDTGSTDPLYGVGNRIGLNTHNTRPSNSMVEIESRLNEQRAILESASNDIPSINSIPKINFNQHKKNNLSAPDVEILENNDTTPSLEVYDLVVDDEDVAEYE